MKELKGNVPQPDMSDFKDGRIIGVIGKQGCGKSLTITYLALVNYKRFNKIYSNYHFFNAPFDYQYFDSKNDIFEYTDGIYNSLIIIDEFHAYLDAYDWRKERVVEFVKKKMVTARRNGNVFILGNQLFRQYPKRLRDIMPSFYSPSIKRKAIKKGKLVPHIMKVTEYEIMGDKVFPISTFYYNAFYVMDKYATNENFDHLFIKEDKKEKDEVIVEEEADEGVLNSELQEANGLD